MAKHADGKEILTNRVNGVIKSFGTFKTSLKNNKDNITEEELNSMLQYLEEKMASEMKELKEIYKKEEDTFSF